MTDQTPAEATEASPVDPVLALVGERFGDRILEVDPAVDHPTFVIGPDTLVDLLTFLRDEPALRFNRLSDVCGVDFLTLRPEGPRFGVVYHVYAMETNRYVRVRVQVDEDEPVVPSITGLWPGANWMEREAYDLYGIRFAGHPDLKRILTPDEWEVHALRKDYQPPPEPIEFSFNPEQWQKAVQRGDG